MHVDINVHQNDGAIGKVFHGPLRHQRLGERRRVPRSRFPGIEHVRNRMAGETGREVVSQRPVVRREEAHDNVAADVEVSADVGRRGHVSILRLACHGVVEIGLRDGKFEPILQRSDILNVG